MFRFLKFHAFVLLCTWACAGNMAYASETTYSTTQTGMIGLNTVPTARMDKEGTVRIGMGTADPYNHGFIGFQIAKPLYINLRQSMLVSSLTKEPQRVYPGMDIKLRIASEGKLSPDIVFGMDSLMGHKRFSSEYFALSKRYYDFDFTGGIAWGRLGSRGHFKNPLANISSHFKRERDYNDEDSAAPSDWFTGEEIGFFGGVEYFTPIKELSLKADFNADAYSGERSSFDFKRPSPWSFGFSYSPKDWVSIGASMLGTDKIMARLSLQGNLFEWGKNYKQQPPKDEIPLVRAEDITIEGSKMTGYLELDARDSSIMQIGRAAKSLAIHADKNIKTITIIPMSDGTKGAAMTFSRRDLEQAELHHRGSPEEIWQDLEFKDHKGLSFSIASPRTLKLVPELSFSPGEEETTHLARASLLVEEQKNWGYGIVTGDSIRVNIADNLSRMAEFKSINSQSIRSDADYFTLNRINMERSYISFLNTPLTDIHFSASGGYLEEMFAGYGAEVLYRPHQSPFSIGLEAWKLYKRDPLTPMAAGIFEDSYKTGFLNFYYEVPDTDITAFAKVGQFIGGDKGVNAGAQMRFSNGMKMRGSFTVSDANEKDVFGKDYNMQAGLELSVPFGRMKYIPKGSEARIKTQPIGRDDGAVLDKPIDLYEVTEPTAYRHLARNWQEVLD